MGNISPSVVIMLLLSVAAHVAGIFFLPLTRGLTQLLPTIASAASFLIGIGLLARLSESGVGLSSLMPILAAIVPLAGIAVGVLVYGETASALKIVTLIFACALVGIANLL